MKLLILKTNIGSSQVMHSLDPIFTDLPVKEWCVDLWDEDKVLRIEADDSLSESDLFHRLASRGVRCEELPE